MGQLALTVVGGVAGALLPGVGWALGAVVGGMIGSSLFGPTVEGPRLSDLSVTSSTYGNTINELFGTCRLNGNVIWSSGIKETKHKQRAGKGGSKQTTYTYSASFAVAFCRGPVTGLIRIWADSKLISGTAYPSSITDAEELKAWYTANTKSSGKNGTTKRDIKFRFYTGSETQLPDALIEADVGAGQTPAYRGMSYIVFEDFQLEDFGNRIPSITAEIAKIPSGQVQNTDLSYSREVLDASAYGAVDWVGNMLYVMDPVAQRVFKHDLTSFELVGSIPWYNSTGSGRVVMPGGGFIFNEREANNSVPVWMVNTNTGAASKIGRTSNALDDYPGGECENFNPQTTANIVGNRQVVPFNIVDSYGNKKACFASLSWFGCFSIYTVDGQYIAHGSLPQNGFDVGAGLLGVSSTAGQEIVVVLAKGGTTRYTRFRVSGPGLVLNDIYKREGCSGSVYSPSGFWSEAYIFDEITIDTEIERIVTIETDGDDSDIVHVTTQTRDSYGNLTTNTITRDKRSTDADGTKTTYDTQAVTYDGFSTVISMVDTTDNTLNMVGVFGKDGVSVNGFIRWSLDEKAIKVARTWNTSVDNYATGGLPTNVMPTSRLQGGTMGWVNGTTAFMVNVQDGRLTKMALDSSLSTAFIFNEGVSWDDPSQSLLLMQGNRWRRFFFRNYGDGASLASLVTDLCKRSNVLSEADIDVEDLLNINCSGYVVSNNATIKDCLNQLTQAYFFDGVETDYVLKFVRRGGDPVLTIPQDELAPADDTTMAAVKETKTQEPELAMRVTINYYSFERDYQTGSQFAKRITNPIPTMFSPVETKTELPIVMTATVAKQIATKSLQTVWSNRTQLTLKMPWKYIALDPTDIINVTRNDGITYRVRADNVDIGVDYAMEVKAVTEKASTYDASMVTGTSGNFPVQWVASAGPATPLVLNTPLLRDLDDTQGRGSVYYLGYNVAMGEAKAVTVQESKEGGTYADTSTILNEAILGYTQTALSDVVYSEATDENTVLVVSFNDAEVTLETVSQEEMLAGANAALVGDEVIQFREADQNDDGTWSLRGILRGRRGTQYAVGTHAIGDRFVLLQAGTFEKATHGVDDYSGTFYVRAVSNGTLESEAEPVTVAFEPNDLKPYTPEAIKATSTGDTVTVTYQRRSRITFGIMDSVINAPYYEGQGQAARIKWQVFIGAEMDDPYILDGSKTPDASGEVPVFNADGTYTTQSFDFAFPLAERQQTIEGADNPSFKATTCVLRIWETGFVDGRPKIVRLKTPIEPSGEASDGQWAYAELY